ncbi:hypothetical protein ILUMI_21087 [Ignelater luminosus]|uniref:Transposable element P transposase-like RNase H C-terminal domain-containing protein n=1 Tax=Ignelater luminosus TaxID=2038154 RepID=A0A8K0CD42_IGNLU|nr:hypothetical protein ILUMI_21087 [Ignelater luminosus]
MDYINKLTNASGKPILLSNRKTGFLGFIINLTNIFELYSLLKGHYEQEYLLTFKLSQDPLETFFSVIRSHGGFNNNPNAKQFESAFKRALLKNEISSSSFSNCLTDGLNILHVTSRKKNIKDLLVDTENVCKEILSEHDYLKTSWTLTPYVLNVVNYIAGFIVYKLKKKLFCTICLNQLIGIADHNTQLIELKNRGPYIFPSNDVKKICQFIEKIIRQHLHHIFLNKTPQLIKSEAFAVVGTNVFDSDVLIDHIKSQDILDNHRVQLIKAVINIYVEIRLHYEAKISNEKSEYLRHKYTKLIHFYHS